MSGWRYSILRILDSDSYKVNDDHFKEEVFRGTYQQCLIFMGCMCERMPYERAKLYALGALLLP